MRSPVPDVAVDPQVQQVREMLIRSIDNGEVDGTIVGMLERLRTFDPKPDTAVYFTLNITLRPYA